MTMLAQCRSLALRSCGERSVVTTKSSMWGVFASANHWANRKVSLATLSIGNVAMVIEKVYNIPSPELRADRRALFLWKLKPPQLGCQAVHCTMSLAETYFQSQCREKVIQKNNFYYFRL